MIYTRIFKENDRPARLEAEDFIGKLQRLILTDPELGFKKTKLVDYYEPPYRAPQIHRLWLYFTPGFSPSGFIKISITRVDIDDGGAETWKVVMETA